MRATQLCPVCGFINTKQATRCLKCQAVLGEFGYDARAFDRLQRRQTVRERIREATDRILAVFRRGHDAARMAGPLDPVVRQSLDTRPPMISALWGLLPGGGCFCNGQRRKGYVFAAIHIALTIAAVATIHEPYSNYVVCALILWMIASYLDGFVTAARGNGQFITPRAVIAAFSALVFGTAIGALLLQLAAYQFVNLVWVSRGGFEGALRPQDRIAVVRCAYWFGMKPQRGDVIYYDPKRYFIGLGRGLEASGYIVNESASFGRVSGVEGDVIERKNGGPILLNGKPLPEKWMPLHPDGIPFDLRFAVPKDRVCVLIGHASEERFMAIEAFGGVGVKPNTPGMRLDGWNEACLVEKSEIMGRVAAIYHPPQRRQFLPSGGKD